MHRTYCSWATFADPDGDVWLWQEITTRLPGCIGIKDPDWSDW
ncbi:hypothetical protein [Amycolatopsis plumensis]